MRTAINLQTLRSKRRMIVISPRMRKWWVASDLHPVAVRQYFSLLKSRDFTLKVCNPEKSDTKAELNRRSQACDGPDRHRCSRRVKWSVRRVTLPIQRIKSPLHHFNACRPNWCSRQDLHLHWRRSRRRASALGYASNGWSLPSELHRQDLFTKEIRRLLPRAGMVAVPGAAPGPAGL